MATTNNTEKIFIGINDEAIELTGKDKEDFIAERQAMNERIALHKAEVKAKQDARESAIKKLADIAGLTEEEIEGLVR